MSGQIGINGNHDLGGVDLKKEAGADPATIEKIDRTAKPNTYWESSIHALLVVLATKKPNALVTTDENRRCVEALEREAYKDWGYYDQWSVSLTTILLERGVITHEEIDEEINGDSPKVSEEQGPIYKVGDVLRVKTEDSRLRWHRPHIRCPGYIYGQQAIVEEYVGLFKDPFLLAFRAVGPMQHLYRVSFDMAALWDKTGAARDQAAAPAVSDRIQADIYEGWLEPYPAPEAEKTLVMEEKKECGHDHSTECDHAHSHAHHAEHHEHKHDHGRHHAHKEEEHKHDHGHDHGHAHAHDHSSCGAPAIPTPTPAGSSDEGHSHGHAHAHSHDDVNLDVPVSVPHSHSDSHAHAHAHAHTSAEVDAGHTHDHGHTHEGRFEVECTAVDREGADANRPGKVVGEALLRLLYKKNVITKQEIHKTIENLEMAGVNMRGADLVVYAWKDPAFKARLIKDAPAAALEHGITTSNPNAPTVLRVVANTPTVHNVIVCTLCSCYPLGLLGFSPSWYKSRAYRARVVFEPRKVLSEFGLNLPSTTGIRVHDSTADCRYFVLPLPPAHLSESDIQSMSHAELKALVTRDSMIGVSVL